MNKYIITEEQIANIEEHGWIDAFHTLDQVRSHPYQSEREFDESNNRGYRCIHCEVRNDVQFCHYHDVPIQSERYRPVCYPDCENENHIRKDERDKALDELLVILEKLSNKDRTAYVPANVEKTTIERIISIVKELR